MNACKSCCVLIGSGTKIQSEERLQELLRLDWEWHKSPIWSTPARVAASRLGVAQNNWKTNLRNACMSCCVSVGGIKKEFKQHLLDSRLHCIVCFKLYMCHLNNVADLKHSTKEVRWFLCNISTRLPGELKKWFLLGTMGMKAVTQYSRAVPRSNLLKNGFVRK